MSQVDESAERILLVDDEPDLQGLVVFNLREAGFVIEAIGTATEAIATAERLKPAVVILDLMLPDLPGTEVCRRLRAHPDLGDVAILMLTARGDEYDRVLGFEVGADDYVVKPFSVRELVLRVKGLAKRAHERRLARSSRDAGQRLTWKGLEVDGVRHRAYADGVELSLRPLEFKLIEAFLGNASKVYSRAQLLEDVWGVTTDINTRTVDTHIKRLREALGSYGEAIETVHGYGYRLRDVRA
jgi:two-component system, OmpR family, phosphate regulon response regulator PhoB